MLLWPDAGKSPGRKGQGGLQTRFVEHPSPETPPPPVFRLYLSFRRVAARGGRHRAQGLHAGVAESARGNLERTGRGLRIPRGLVN